MNAIEAATLNLGLAAGKLESPSPTPDDLSEAMKHTKAALDIIKAALALTAEGVFAVCPEPVAGTPLPFGE